MDGDVVVHRIFHCVVEGGGVERLCLGEEGFTEGLDEAKEGGRVEGEGCAAAGVGGRGVLEGGELRAGEMVAVHRDKGGDRGGGEGGEFLGVEGVDAGCNEGGEGSLA